MSADIPLMVKSLSEVERPSRVEPKQNSICQIYQRYNIETLDEFEMVVGDYMNKRGWSTFEDSDAFRSALVKSFEDAYLEESGKIVIPDAMQAALIDASYWVMDQEPVPSARIGTVIAPMLTEKVGYIMPAYAERGLDTVGYYQEISNKRT